MAMEYLPFIDFIYDFPIEMPIYMIYFPLQCLITGGQAFSCGIAA
jgi:hypothetical protein